MKRAIRKRWPVSKEMKEALMDRMHELLLSEPEIAVGAARVIVAAEAQNQNDVLKRRARDARIAIQNVLQIAEPSAPDPEFLQWKQERAMAEALKDDVPQVGNPAVPTRGTEAGTDEGTGDAVQQPAPDGEGVARPNVLKMLVDARRGRNSEPISEPVDISKMEPISG